ncbi:hypothetical protein CLAIMM_00018, partial [Cladophialophora immunda]
RISILSPITSHISRKDKTLDTQDKNREQNPEQPKCIPNTFPRTNPTVQLRDRSNIQIQGSKFGPTHRCLPEEFMLPGDFSQAERRGGQRGQKLHARPMDGWRMNTTGALWS